MKKEIKFLKIVGLISLSLLFLFFCLVFILLLFDTDQLITMHAKVSTELKAKMFTCYKTLTNSIFYLWWLLLTSFGLIKVFELANRYLDIKELEVNQIHKIHKVTHRDK